MLPKERQIRLLAVLLIPAVALIMGAAATRVWADDPECFFNIEFNATDRDVGVRGFFDYEPYDVLELRDPDGEPIANLDTSLSLALQGIAEFFFESGEPNLEDLSLVDFLDRFGVGIYVYGAAPIDEEDEDFILCPAVFTHVIPCGPEIRLTGRVIRWDPVTTVVDPSQTDQDDVVCVPPGDLEQELNIVGYEVVAENEDGEFIIKLLVAEFIIKLPSSATSVLVPPQFGTIEKYEVLAIDEDGNQSITEEVLVEEEE
jgi:hypothetical protein